MTTLYNEIDPFAGAWLRALCDEGAISNGVIDNRSVEDLLPSEVEKYERVHLFAGIGVWDHALNEAGYGAGLPVWTCSCPCQPFSAAGKGGRFADERHLWPAAFHLIGECRPLVVFGEQVASPDGYAWLDLVQADMEGAGYALGSVVVPAAGFGAPHGRHRIYWVSHPAGRVAGDRHLQPGGQHRLQPGGGAVVVVDESPVAGRQGRTERRVQRGQPDIAGAINGFWGGADWLPCTDGFYRPTQPGIFPLADGTAGRVGTLRGYGNALVAPQAVEFVRCYLETLS